MQYFRVSVNLLYRRTFILLVKAHHKYICDDDDDDGEDNDNDDDDNDDDNDRLQQAI